MIKQKKSPTIIVSILLTFLCLSFHPQNDEELQIFLIGDSTMANKPGTPEENPERGWGQALSLFFNEKVVVKNHAVNGRSTKSFIDEKRWESVMNELEPGDYVFIQFGHNDQKYKDPKRYTNPWTAYRRNLEKFVVETRRKGAFPILLSSIVRRNFNEYGTLEDTHGVYPFVARTVADQLDVPFIDMQLLTEDYINELGVEASKEIYLWVKPGVYEKFPDGRQDNTHLTLKGAKAYAKLVCETIKDMEMPLAYWLR